MRCQVLRDIRSPVSAGACPSSCNHFSGQSANRLENFRIKMIKTLQMSTFLGSYVRARRGRDVSCAHYAARRSAHQQCCEENVSVRSAARCARACARVQAFFTSSVKYGLAEKCRFAGKSTENRQQWLRTGRGSERGKRAL